MDITRLIAISLCCLIIITLIKKYNADHALLASSFLCVSICVFSFRILLPVFEYIKLFEKTSTAGNYCTIILKSAGVCMLCSLASELCNDIGETSIASKIEFAGKCTLIAFSLPLIKKVFEYATTFIK